MEIYDVSAEDRVVGGKGAVRRLKNEGFIPGILYGKDISMPISLRESELKGILNQNSSEVLFNLNFNGEVMTVKVKDVYRDPVTQVIKHIDLMPFNGEIDKSGQLH